MLRIRTTGWAAALASLTAFATLFSQILAHRIISAKLLNNYAFLVISLTMLGFAASGVILTRGLKKALATAEDSIPACAGGFALSFLLISTVFYHVSMRSQGGAYLLYDRQAFLSQLLSCLPWALLYAIPFLFLGLILGVLLAAPEFSTPRVYFADLVGSALGAAVVPLCIRSFGVEVSGLGLCAFFMVAMLVLCRPGSTWSWAVNALACVLLLTAFFTRQEFFRMVCPEGSLLSAPNQILVKTDMIAWDPVARIEVSSIRPPGPYFLITDNPVFIQRFVKMISQNNWAFTPAVDYDGNLQTLAGIEDTVAAAIYHATSVTDPNTLIIGVGGGYDILTALYFHISRITAVELNSATVNILTRSMRDYFHHWVEDPHVQLHNDEGRHFLASQGGTYDIIQLSGVDTYSGTPAATYVFTETYLYTKEAMNLYWDHLTEQGIFCIFRSEWVPPREVLRVMVTAMTVLRERGVQDPSQHIIIIVGTQKVHPMASMLVKKTPFTPEQVQRVVEWASRSRIFQPAAAPGMNSGRQNAFQLFLSTPEDQLPRLLDEYPFDVRPVTDDRPFFFRFSYWKHLFGRRAEEIKAVPAMETSVVVLLILIALATVVSVYLPLRLLAGSVAAYPSAGRFGGYFASIALGYMAVEIALLQKFGLLLGHPNYALSVVLAALLFFTGLGSLSLTFVPWLGRPLRASLCLVAVVALECLAIFPLFPGLMHLSLPARVLVTVALVAPIGWLLGVFLPTGLERVKAEAPAFGPWAWGLNGMFSVLGPVLAVAAAMSWGMTTLMFLALPIYLLAGFLLPAEAGVDRAGPGGEEAVVGAAASGGEDVSGGDLAGL